MKAIRHHSTSPDVFVGSHLLTGQKPVIECYIIEQFIWMIAQWSIYDALLDVLGVLCIIKNKKENLH